MRYSENVLLTKIEVYGCNSRNTTRQAHTLAQTQMMLLNALPAAFVGGKKSARDFGLDTFGFNVLLHVLCNKSNFLFPLLPKYFLSKAF